MSSGGHFKSYWNSRKSRQYLPGINRIGSKNLRPFLEETNIPNTAESQDPLLVSKPITNKKPDISHETDRIIHTR